jgi:hypothetical protein
MQSYAPYRWRARTTDGSVMTFGEASRMPGCTPSDQYAPLTGMVDAFSNEVRYEYTQTIPGECKLMRITWGQNNPAGLPDVAQVNLTYKIGNVCNGVYTNSQTDYRSGNRIVTGASRLQEIEARAYAPGAPSPVHTRTITLAYDEQAETCQQPHAPVRLLKSIQESAWGTDSPRVDLPAVIFDYNPATVTMWWPPQPGPKPVPWYGDPTLGWGYRGGDWPSVEMMFLDIDGDGLQDVVENASGPVHGECVARWKRNLGPDANGNLHFGPPAPPLQELISLPRLKWKGSASPWPTQGASQADPVSGEYCALNGQATAFRNAYPLSGACHHAPGTTCRPARIRAIPSSTAIREGPAAHRIRVVRGEEARSS